MCCQVFVEVYLPGVAGGRTGTLTVCFTQIAGGAVRAPPASGGSYG